MIAHLLATPIFNAIDAAAITGKSDVSTYNAINRLTEAGIVDVLSSNKRNRVWAAPDVLAELDALSKAIGHRSAAARSATASGARSRDPRS